jgi:hypothetical protein
VALTKVAIVQEKKLISVGNNTEKLNGNKNEKRIRHALGKLMQYDKQRKKN